MKNQAQIEFLASHNEDEKIAKNTQVLISIETAKQHAKRLQKSINKRNSFCKNKTDALKSESIKLMEAQNIFAESLGCKNWHDLQKKLENKIANPPNITKEVVFNEENIKIYSVPSYNNKEHPEQYNEFKNHLKNQLEKQNKAYDVFEKIFKNVNIEKIDNKQKEKIKKEVILNIKNNLVLKTEIVKESPWNNFYMYFLNKRTTKEFFWVVENFENCTKNAYLLSAILQAYSYDENKKIYFDEVIKFGANYENFPNSIISAALSSKFPFDTLLKQGINFSLNNKRNNEAFSNAVTNGNIEVMQKFLDVGYNLSNNLQALWKANITNNIKSLNFIFNFYSKEKIVELYQEIQKENLNFNFYLHHLIKEKFGANWNKINKIKP